MVVSDLYAIWFHINCNDLKNYECIVKIFNSNHFMVKILNSIKFPNHCLSRSIVEINHYINYYSHVIF